MVPSHPLRRWRLIEVNPAASVEPPRARRAEITVVDKDLADRLLTSSEGTRFEAHAKDGMTTVGFLLPLKLTAAI